MRVSEALDKIERRLQHPLTRKTPLPRPQLLEMYEQKLGELADIFPHLVRRLEPVIYTEKDLRSYDLPEDFPANFLRLDDESLTDEDRYACFLDDGTNEAKLHYKSPARFFSDHKDTQTASRPIDYTIIAGTSGREIVLGPPPDANSDSQYTIAGVYRPDVWKVQEEEDITLIPGDSAIVEYAVLAELDPNRWGEQFQSSLARTYLRSAQAHVTKMVPYEAHAGVRVR